MADQTANIAAPSISVSTTQRVKRPKVWAGCVAGGRDEVESAMGESELMSRRVAASLVGAVFPLPR